jgi:hypothetical protein
MKLHSRSVFRAISGCPSHSTSKGGQRQGWQNGESANFSSNSSAQLLTFGIALSYLDSNPCLYTTSVTGWLSSLPQALNFGLAASIKNKKGEAGSNPPLPNTQISSNGIAGMLPAMPSLELLAQYTSRELAQPCSVNEC